MSLDFFQNWLQSLGLDPAATSLTTQVFIVVLAVLAVNLTLGIVFGQLLKHARQTNLVWDDAALEALGRPLRLLVWLLGLAFAADMVGAHTDAPIFEAVDPIRKTGVIALMAWMITRLIRNTERSLVAHREQSGKPTDQATVSAVAKLLRLSVIITAVLIAMQTLGFSVSGVLAFGGIGGIAVGFAAKDLLANFFGAMMIYFDRPFIVGEWICSPDKEIEGTVEEIGWRLTRIRTFDKRPLYVPNSAFASIAVENPSRMSNRRIKETIGIRYEDAEKMEEVIWRVKQMLREHPDIDQNATLIVNFNCFAPSSLDFFIYTFTKTTNWIEFHEVKQDVLLKIIEIISGVGAEFAYPTSTLHIARPDDEKQSTAPDFPPA